ncbi:MAG: hypothetical protein JO250_15625 [Armatimonadetes bacterium]|nr:hypothetical protein [Armatimonadota bacterium]
MWLDFVGCRDSGKGYSGRALRWLCALADAHGVHLYLTVYGLSGREPGFLSDEALEAWYRRHGFAALAPSGGKATMVRRPQARREV